MCAKPCFSLWIGSMSSPCRYDCQRRELYGFPPIPRQQGYSLPIIRTSNLQQSMPRTAMATLIVATASHPHDTHPQRYRPAACCPRRATCCRPADEHPPPSPRNRLLPSQQQYAAGTLELDALKSRISQVRAPCTFEPAESEVDSRHTRSRRRRR